MNKTIDFEHATTTVNGKQIHYVRGGSGKPVLLWHGFLGTWYSWRKVMPLLLERGYTVIAPDMRGYGDSDKPETGYDAQTLADDFHTLMTELGFAEYAIVAHDMGAPAALLLTARHPRAIRVLAYLEEPVLLQQTITELFTFTPEALQNGGLWWWLFALAPNLPETLVAGKEAAFLMWFYDVFTVNRAGVEPEAVTEYTRTFAGEEGVRGALGVYRAIFDSMAQTEVLLSHKVTVPILGIGGEKSMGANVGRMLQNVAHTVQTETLQGASHFLAEEQPEALCEMLLRFFAPNNY